MAGLAALPLVAVLFALASGGAEALVHLWRTTLPTYALNTFALMAMVGALSTVIGVGTAWIVSTCRFPGRGVFSWALVLPIAAPAYVIAYFYTDLLEVSGPVQTAIRAWFGVGIGAYPFPEIRTLPGAAVLLSLVLYPYIYLLARASFAATSASQFLAARSLGMGPWRAFVRVALPGARPAIVGGLALVLMETLADYGVADYFAIPTFSTGIFRTWFGLGERTTAMQLAGVMLGVAALLLLLEALSRRGQTANYDRLDQSKPLFELSFRSGTLAFVACLMPVLLGFLIPASGLAWQAVTVGDPQGFGILAGYAGNSITVGVLVALIGILIAFLLVYARRATQSAFRQEGSWVIGAGIRFSTLGYALPGAFLAVGLLSPLGGFDQTITRFARDSLGWQGGLILSGSVILLVYALVVRFLTVAFNSVSGGMAKIPLSIDAAAQSLGTRPKDVMRRIHAPLLAPHIAAGLSLVFVDVMRELPATLILRPFNFETLATRVYRLASDERLAEASTSALIIVALGLIPVVLLNRAPNRKGRGRIK
ncbi:MAG: iron ABC transporter permease [Pseudomonadota bacterium]